MGLRPRRMRNMKKILLVVSMAAALAVGGAQKAEAVPLVTMVICQGLTCVAVADTTADPDIFTGVNATVGDFHITTLTSTGQEGNSLSSGSQTELAVHRFFSTSPLPLDVYMVAANFVLPNPAQVLDTSLSVTNTTGAGTIAFQGWYSNTNSTVVSPPPGFPSGTTNG